MFHDLDNPSLLLLLNLYLKISLIFELGEFCSLSVNTLSCLWLKAQKRSLAAVSSSKTTDQGAKSFGG